MNYFNKQNEWLFFAEQITSLSGNLTLNSNLKVLYGDLDLGGNLCLNNTWIKDTSGITFSDGTLLTSGNITSTSVNEGNIISDLTLIKSVLEYYFHDIDIHGNQQYVTAEELNINGNIRGNNLIGDLYGNIYKNDLFIDTSSVDIKDIMTIDQNNIAIGKSAGSISQKSYGIAIGYNSGYSSQGLATVAIGYNSGKNNQSGNSVAVGAYSGHDGQNVDAVSVGQFAGYSSQRTGGVAIGKAAGYISQGSHSIAIGYMAGYNDQSNNTIILNAKGTPLNSVTDNGFYVAPIASETSTNYLYYNIATKQITYGDMNLSMLQDNEVFKKTSDNKLGGSNLFVYYSDVGINIHVMETKVGTTSLSRIISTNTIDNKHILTLEPRSGGSRYFELHDDNSNLFIKTIGSAFNIDNEIRIQSSTNYNYHTLINSSVSGTSLYTKIQGVNPGAGDYHHLDIINYNRVSISCLTSPNVNNRGVFLSGPTVNVNGTFYNSSDDRLKDNESPITNVYDKISSLNVLQYTKYTYDPNTGDRTGEGKPEYGLIAQDLLNTDLSFAVSEQVDDCYYSVAYQNLFCLNLEATKQLIQQVTTLSAEVDRLKERIITLESR